MEIYTNAEHGRPFKERNKSHNNIHRKLKKKKKKKIPNGRVI
jgi:hypothetical protein